MDTNFTVGVQAYIQTVEFDWKTYSAKITKKTFDYSLLFAAVTNIVQENNETIVTSLSDCDFQTEKYKQMFTSASCINIKDERSYLSGYNS